MERAYPFVKRKQASYAQDKTDWKAALGAGFIGAVIFIMLEMLMVMSAGQSLWGPPRMIAAMVMGRDVLPPPASFEGGIMATAMMIHFPLSLAYGLILGWVVHRLTGINAFAAGMLFGIVIYLINFYLAAPVLFPWFMQARNWTNLVIHLVYGAALGAGYAGLRRHKSLKPH